MKPLITIITATYNTQCTIGKTIESIRHQSFKDFEWIIIDGGSNDLTMEIIKDNADIVTTWISEVDAGIYDAWNKGLNFARGEWVAFLGAGDCFLPNALQAYADEIRMGDNEVELISSRIKLVDSSDRVLGMVGAQFDFRQHKKSMAIAHVGAFHKKTLFKKFGKFDLRYSIAGDYEYFMRCGSNLKTSFIDLVTVSMLVGGASSSYSAILETYKVQNQYGVPIFVAKIRCYIAVFKNILRRLIRDY